MALTIEDKKIYKNDAIIALIAQTQVPGFVKKKETSPEKIIDNILKTTQVAFDIGASLGTKIDNFRQKHDVKEKVSFSL